MLTWDQNAKENYTFLLKVMMEAGRKYLQGYGKWGLIEMKVAVIPEARLIQQV